MKPSEPAPLHSGRKARPRDIAWGILIAMFAVSMALSVLSMGNYTEVSKAMALTHVVTANSAEPVLDGFGNLESVNMTVEFTIANPSSREIRVWLLTYKSWVRDLPLEAGDDTGRRWTDGTVTVNGTEQRYYPMFTASFSFDSPRIIVPAGSNFTITRHILLDSVRFPDIMSNFVEIYEYAMVHGLELEWLHHTTSILFVHDLPKLPEANRDEVMIRRFEGWDLTPGTGGAYP